VEGGHTPILLRAAEVDEVAAVIKAIGTRSGSGDDLKGNRPLHFCIALRINLEELIRAQVGDDEFAADKSGAVSTGLELLAVEIERDFGDHIRLILFRDGGGIAGRVHEAGQEIKPVGEVNATGIPQLARRCFPAVENAIRKQIRRSDF